MEISIPKEVLALHRFCPKATEEGTPGMSRMRFKFQKAQGRAQVANGTVACEVTWTDPEYGLDGEAHTSLLGSEAKHLAKMAGEDQVLYNHEDRTFSCGSFTLPATQPPQAQFKFMDEALEGALYQLQPKAVKGARFDAKVFKSLVDMVAKLGADVPLVFYGEKRPTCLEVEKGELHFKFLVVGKG